MGLGPTRAFNRLEEEPGVWKARAAQVPVWVASASLGATTRFAAKPPELLICEDERNEEVEVHQVTMVGAKRALHAKLNMPQRTMESAWRHVPRSDHMDME